MGKSQYVWPLMLPQSQTIAPTHAILSEWIHTSLLGLHMTASPAVSERLGQTIQTSLAWKHTNTAAVFLDGPESSWTWSVLCTLQTPSMNAACQTNSLQILIGITTWAASWRRHNREVGQVREGPGQDKSGRACLMICAYVWIQVEINSHNSPWRVG